VQGGERNAGQKAGDAPLHAAEGDRPDQPEHALTQEPVGFATTAVRALAFPLHGLQFRFAGCDEHVDLGERVP
jgi:hypothetical protein